MIDEPNPPADPAQRQALAGKVRRNLSVALVIAAILAVWGIGLRMYARAELRASTLDAATITVAVTKPVRPDGSEELVLPGIVQAYVESPIYARTSGYLKAWYTDIGARVKKGDLLALIDTPEVDSELAQAKAELATAEANARLAELTNERWQGLLKTQSVSQQDADNKAGDAAAKRATAESARQNVDRLQALESFKRVLAPFDGVVTARNTDVGDLINAGQSAGSELFRMSDVRRLRIYVQVPEIYATAVQTGLKAELRFAERPGKPYPAQTVRTANALDPNTRTLQAELQLDNHAAELLPGAYTEVHFKVPPGENVLRLPANAVIFRSKGLEVAVVEKGDTVRIRKVDQGRDFGSTVEILAGLEPNDVVVLNPPDSIADGTHVRIVGKGADGKTR